MVLPSRDTYGDYDLGNRGKHAKVMIFYRSSDRKMYSVQVGILSE